MKKSVQFAGILAQALVGTLTFTSLFGASANAETRPQDESSWRESYRGDGRDDRYDDRHGRDSRYDDRSFLAGTVERVDHRRGVVFLRARNSSRRIVVQMTRRNTRGGLDVDDLRRGDYASFVGDWSRGGVFTAWRIDDIDSRNGRGRNRR